MELHEIIEHKPEFGAIDVSKFKELSDIGFSLIRLKPLGKEADREARWQQYCGTFRAFEQSGYKHGENMGIAVGPASHVVVIDIDNPHQFIQWCLNNHVNVLPQTRIHKTPRGFHIFFQRFDDIPVTLNKIVRKDMGCEFMFNCTQVVAPGSVVRKDDNEIYKYVTYEGSEVARSPEWVRRCVESHGADDYHREDEPGLMEEAQRETDHRPDKKYNLSTPEAGGIRNAGEGIKWASKYLAEWIERLKDGTIPHGSRNDTLFKVLSGAAGLGANKSMLLSYSGKIGDALGLSRFEALKTAESAAKKIGRTIQRRTPSASMATLIMKARELSVSIAKPIGINLDINMFLDGMIGEYELAKAIEEFYIDKYRYCPTNRKWYKNTSNIWRLCDNPSVLKPCLDFLKHYMDSDDTIRESLKKQYITLQSAKTLNAIITLLKSSESKIAIEESAFDNNAMKLPLRNAIVEMCDRTSTIVVREIHWKDYIRKHIELDWPGAFGNFTVEDVLSLRDKDFYEFDELLNRIFYVNIELKEVVTKLFGYALSGTSDKIKKLPIMIGEGNNGKSVLFKALQCSLTPLAVTVDKSVIVAKNTSSPKPELLVLQGARIGFIGETDEADCITEASAKALTGGDIRTARNLYSSEMVQLQPTYTLIMATNHEPRIPGGGAAIWNRLLPIPFNTIFTKSPTRNNELPITDGIWNWASTPHIGVILYLLYGWLAYCEDGLGKMPDVVINYHSQYMDEEDPYAEFRDACLLKDDTIRVKSRDIVIGYRNWCNDNQVYVNPRISDRTIKRGILSSVKEWNVTEIKYKNLFCMKGLGMLPSQYEYCAPRQIKYHKGDL